jgi:hypothetical protein
VEGFRTRIGSRGEWGQSRVGRHSVELILTRKSAERLIELVGHTGDIQ